MTATLQKAFRDSRRGMVWLSIGLALYVLFTMAFYSTILEQADEFNDLINSYPEEMMGMFFGDEMGDIDLSEPGTFIQTYFASYGLLIIGVIGIAHGFGAVTNPERDGTLDVMMSLPVSRRAYLLGRFLNTVIVLLVVLTAIFVTYCVSMLLWPAFDIAVGDLALAIYGAFFPLLVVAAFVYMVAALFPSRMHVAGPLAYLFLVGSYLVHGFSATVDQLSGLKPLLLFHYYNAATLVRDGPNLGHWALLMAVALLYWVVAWWTIDRKELGV